MALLIDNDVVDRVLDMPDALGAIESGLEQLARGDAVIHPRTGMWSPTAADGDFYLWSCQLGMLRSPPRLAIRFKSEVLTWTERDGGVIQEKHNVEPGTYMGVVQLFDTSTGALIGFIHDGLIQHVRTGALAGIACKYLAREDAHTVGLLGSGGMAESYLRAFSLVRDVTEARVFSPTAAHREGFAESMAAELGIEVVPVESAEAAMTGVDIAATCTSSLTPVYDPDWTEPGQFITNVTPVETPDEVLEAADRTYVSKADPGFDYIIGDEADRARVKGFYPTPRSDLATPIVDVVGGDDPGRTDDDETIFYSNISLGGIQFVTIGNLVYERAVENGYGTVVPLAWFQQSVKS